MVWPKEWIDAVYGATSHIQNLPTDKMAKNALDRLHSVGALKDPGRVFEFWWCKECNYRAGYADNVQEKVTCPRCLDHGETRRMVKMREVLHE